MPISKQTTCSVELEDEDDVEGSLLGQIRQIIDTTLMVSKDHRVVRSEQALNDSFFDFSGSKIHAVTVLLDKEGLR